MATVLASEMTVRPDSYYIDASKRALAAALEEAQQRDLDADATRFALHRAFPFGPNRGGREYKIFRQILLQMEDDLGYERRTHKDCKARDEEQEKEARKKPPAIPTTEKRFQLPDSRDELLRQWPRPDTYQASVRFIRKHCRAIITTYEDYDRLRVVLKGYDYVDRSVKFEITTDIDVEAGDESWETAYLDAAQEAWDAWSKRELRKYNV